jgi:hypothetical protein
LRASVAGALDATTGVARNGALREFIVTVHDTTQFRVAEARSEIGRPDNVGEQHGGQNTIRVPCGQGAGNELLNLVEERIHVTDPGDVIPPREEHSPRVGDPIREFARFSW